MSLLLYDVRSGSSGSFGVPADKDEKRLPLTSLDGYALERWEVRRMRAVNSVITLSITRLFSIIWYLPERVSIP